jgi:hypothetical protein
MYPEKLPNTTFSSNPASRKKLEIWLRDEPDLVDGQNEGQTP